MPATPPCSGRPAPSPQRQAPAGHPPCLHERSPVHARPVGFQPRPRLRHAWRPARPAAPNGQDDQTNEVKLRNPSGRLRLPAYILIALVIALAAILLVAAGLLLAPS